MRDEWRPRLAFSFPGEDKPGLRVYDLPLCWRCHEPVEKTSDWVMLAVRGYTHAVVAHRDCKNTLPISGEAQRQGTPR